MTTGKMRYLLQVIISLLKKESQVCIVGESIECREKRKKEIL